jgi:arylsulfatase/arylsulfatase A
MVHAAPPDRPNIILIMTDDQGRGDFSCMDNPVIKTPHLDRLAEGAAWMTRFYVSPVCAPTRACLMTGRYNYRTRAIDTFVGRAMMEPEEVTVAEVLRDAGYATGIFGKWHLGDCYPMRPMDQGFEESLVHRGGGIGQPGDPPDGESKYSDPVLFHNGRQVQTEGYCTDVYFNSAMKWIEQQHDKGRSFFAYIPTNAPHGPFHDVPEDLYEQYMKMDLQSIMLQKNNPKGYRNNTDTIARIFAMIANIDENVGRLQKKLKDLNILDNTIVIFLTDNGPNSLRYVGDVRGMKSNVHEGGIRTVFWVHWPAQLKAGYKCDVTAAHIDVMPTLLDACGIAPPANVKFDGRSILPLLKGEKVEWPERTLFIQSHRGDLPVLYHHVAGIRQQWKLVHPSGFGREQLPHPPKWELYDLLADPGERNNLAGEHPEIVQDLKKKYEQWFEDVGSTRPDNYAPPRIYVGTPHENPVVLTRQDWRHDAGKPWALDSNGHWELYVASEGMYNVNVRFKQPGARTRVELRIGDQTQSLMVDPFDGGCTFRNIALKPGNANLAVTMAIGDKKQGPWQVDVVRQ